MTFSRPSRSATAVVGLVLLILMAVSAGCGGGPSAEVKEQFGQAREHYEKAKEAIKTLGSFKKNWESVFSSGVTPDAVAKARVLLTAAQKNEQTALDELRSMERSLLVILDMNASEEMKTYVKMKVSALREQEKIFEVELNAMLLRLQSIAEQEAGAPVEQVLEIQNRISDLEKEAGQHSKKARALINEANDYYDEKKLGG